MLPLFLLLLVGVADVVITTVISVLGGGGSRGSVAVVDGSVGRSMFMHRDPARRLITEKNFIKGKFKSRTRKVKESLAPEGSNPSP